jgi:hypothetical protein
MSEGNNVEKMAEENNDLYIGVRNDLSPFYVDLKALTRGLVVVGQSGCGKSFLVGRLVEELVRNTKEKTRLLIIDSNSDFCEGLKPKDEQEFTKDINTYDSGLFKNGEFGVFKDKEMQDFKKFKSTNQLPIGQLFGRGEPFNLSWKWLIDNATNFLRIVKAGKFSIGYPWALLSLKSSLRDEYKYLPEKWISAGSDIITNQIGKGDESEYIDDELALKFKKWLDSESFQELLRDLGSEVSAGIWRKNPNDKGLPEQLFADSRVNFVEVERIPISEKKSRLKTVTFILLHCLTKHIELIEKYRVLRIQGGEKAALKQAEQDLKHTFILIDEAHNYAPDETNDPHEKMLGELIHTIAAEGRKYGLHVILATQRPNKIKRGLLGECDNAIIMKMNSRSDLEHLAKEMRILDVKLLEPCLHFQGQGNALAVGEMTRMAPYVQLFKSAPRRTVEGGVDIPDF